MTTNSYLEGYMTAEEARAILDAGASYIRVVVDIEAGEAGNVYGITGEGADAGKQPMGAPIPLCPTPCPTKP